MLLTLTTTHRPATDLGYLLAKHPDRLQTFPLGFGSAHVFYPEASEERCTAAVMLDLDPVALVRGRPGAGADGEGSAGPLSTYVNDRPYVASSFMSVAISKVLGSALNGRTTARPELVAAELPLAATVGPVRTRGGMAVVERLFVPLGYDVAAEPVAAPDGAPSRYCKVILHGTVRLQSLLSHLYVLVPVLDDHKHYWVAEDEIDKLLRHGEGWLQAHPERDFIARRYLRRGAGLARKAIARLAALDDVPDEEGEAESASADTTAKVEEPLDLHEQRHHAVLQALRDSGATTVLDLGCGEGRLLRQLLRDKRFTRVVGADVSLRALEVARERLHLDRMNERERARVDLLHTALTYRDRRLSGFEVAAMVEVVEHVEPARLPALERAVFGHARPRTLVLTTPNRDWNATIPALADGKLRHPDHRFEWTRAEFEAWTGAVANAYGYAAELSEVGEPHPELGAPTQVVVFRCVA